MIGYVLMNSKGEFICKDKKGDCFLSTDRLHKARFYRRLKYLENLLADQRYWQRMYMDVKDFKPTKIELSYKIIEE